MSGCVGGSFHSDELAARLTLRRGHGEYGRAREVCPSLFAHRCGRPAVMTLTYVYADSTAVLGPLSTAAEPHAYDLCEQHSERLSAPRGWEVLRLAGTPVATGPSDDDLLALADAVREAAVRPVQNPISPHLVESVHTDRLDDLRPSMIPSSNPGRPARRPERRNHLRVLDADPTPS